MMVHPYFSRLLLFHPPLHVLPVYLRSSSRVPRRLPRVPPRLLPCTFSAPPVYLRGSCRVPSQLPP
eukprot:356272-Pyramimonas_sp.AAC.1